jgi:hypothetical protein
VSEASAGWTPANLLRFIGSGVLVLGLTAAAIRYFAYGRSTAPTIDELMPGYSERRARTNAIIMGNMVVALLGGLEALKDPTTQAVIIAVVSILTALVCYRIAWLMELPNPPSPESPSE